MIVIDSMMLIYTCVHVKQLNHHLKQDGSNLQLHMYVTNIVEILFIKLSLKNLFISSNIMQLSVHKFINHIK